MTFKNTNLYKIILVISFTLFFTISALAQENDASEDEFSRNIEWTKKPVKKPRIQSIKRVTTTVKDGKQGVKTPPPSPKKTTPIPQPKITGGMKIWLERKTVGESNFSQVSPSAIFQSGEIVRMRLKVNFTGYLTVIMRGSSGATQVIFPTNQDNKLLPNQICPIPNDTGWQFDNQSGNETLFFVVSLKPLNFTKSLIEEIANEHLNTTRDFILPKTENDSLYVFVDKARFSKQLVQKLVLTHQ